MPTFKDENGDIVEEKMDSISSNVPHSSSEPTAIGDAHLDKATISHDTNPSSQGAKLQQNVETDKNNQENKRFGNYVQFAPRA